MSGATNWPIAIPLAKDRWRLAALVTLRAGVGGLAVWTGWVTPGAIGTFVVVCGAILVAYAIFLAAWITTVRVEVWRGHLDVAWVLRLHRYQLASGSIRAVRAPRRGAGRLLAPFNNLGLQLGPSRINRRERLTVIHLAHAASLIAVPTVEGRLAIAPADVHELVVALLRATRS